MKVTLVLCVLAMAVALVFGSGGHDAGHGDDTGGHGDDGHGAAAGGHGAAATGGHGDDGHGAAAGHGDAGHGDDGKGAATTLQLCSTLFSFALIAALNKLR